jgi:hypothetical protein
MDFNNFLCDDSIFKPSLSILNGYLGGRNIIDNKPCGDNGSLVLGPGC